MERKYVLAIDQSTQGTKAILFDQVGKFVCRADRLHQQIVNKKGWISHDLSEIYQNTIQVVKDVVEKSGIEKNEIACLGISNQRETSAAWNKNTGEPLADAIVWQCARAEDICENIKQQGVEEQIRQKTGIHLSPYFPASKYAWMEKYIEAVKYAKINNELCLGTIDSWLVYKLTKGATYATDYSNASRTQLFNIHTLKWDEEICRWFGINSNQLPVVHDSAFLYGYTDFEGFLEIPIPITGVIGDSQGALFGQGCVKKGSVKATYGTGSSVMMNIGEQALLSEAGLVTSVAWGISGKVSYVLEGNINYTGAVITWLKDELGLITLPEETQTLAEKANPDDDTYLVPAFSGLGAPYWNADAKASIYGMSRMTGKNEIVKAAVESIAYQIKDIVDLMKRENSLPVEKLCVDGGPTKNKYLMQFQSDILDTVVSLPECEESSALGAARLAGIQFGMYAKDEIVPRTVRQEYHPSMSLSRRMEKYQGWQEAIKKAIL